MSHVAYPESLPTDCISDVIRIIRTRAVASERKVFVNCLWGISGYGLKLSVGDPDNPEPVFGDSGVTDEQLEECRAAIESAEVEPNFGAGEDDAKLDPAVIAMLMQLAMAVITKWLERRKQGS